MNSQEEGRQICSFPPTASRKTTVYSVFPPHVFPEALRSIYFKLSRCCERHNLVTSPVTERNSKNLLELQATYYHVVQGRMKLASSEWNIQQPPEGAEILWHFQDSFTLFKQACHSFPEHHASGETAYSATLFSLKLQPGLASTWLSLVLWSTRKLHYFILIKSALQMGVFVGFGRACLHRAAVSD